MCPTCPLGASGAHESFGFARRGAGPQHSCGRWNSMECRPDRRVKAKPLRALRGRDPLVLAIWTNRYRTKSDAHRPARPRVIRRPWAAARHVRLIPDRPDRARAACQSAAPARRRSPPAPVPAQHMRHDEPPPAAPLSSKPRPAAPDQRRSTASHAMRTVPVARACALRADPARSLLLPMPSNCRSMGYEPLPPAHGTMRRTVGCGTAHTWRRAIWFQE